MDITELSNQTGLASSKIRYYEKMGLIKSAGRKGLKRTFKEDVIYTLAFIRLSQSCGLSLEEINKVLKRNQKINLDKETIDNKVKEIDSQISELKRMKKTLNHLKSCPKKYHFDCDQFRTLLMK
ncbi:MerR family transcriptional regulator [Halobacteriovorax sp. GB3]|uniref:MerR family DNA-binding protein n=1 Tax=Halobacteriovorax sp. GB3 TaxID=2719615 RepID=UPI00235EF918|nr:MerR family DNA-binding protein [Halobacteriovorax sp. GB3]MDD0853635.1 MerR family transcriptional regulator [Halobacteriovorax sp. GB3]